MIDFKDLKKISKNFTLLFVEDDNTLREQTTKIFSNLFKSVDVAENGKVGLDLYNAYNEKTGFYYDIVVSDIEMPYIDGIELSKMIFEINKDQKIVIMSAYDDKEYLSSLVNIGIECFMQKPLTTVNLIDTMYKVCSLFEDESSILLKDGYYFNDFLKILFHNTDRIDMSFNEIKLLELLLSEEGKKFTSQEIFKHIYEDDLKKDDHKDSIKNLINILSSKLPEDTLFDDGNMGYSLDLRSR